MASDADGIAAVFAGLSSQTWKFQALRTGGQVGSIQSIAGTWDRPGGAGTNTISWNGDNPSMTNNDGQTRTVTHLRVGDDAGGAGENISVISHTGVELTDGSSITYTAINISFTSDDTP